MPQFQMARNVTTTLYEVHVAGCRHLVMGHTGNPYTDKFDFVSSAHEAETGKAAAKQYESGNEGCLTKLGPCAKKGSS